VTGALPDRSGIQAYLVVEMAEDDPERKPRPVGGQKDKTPHRTIAKMDAGQVRIVLLQHMADGVARTMNRIGIELWDKPSSVLFQSKVETELWQLVEEGELEFTMEAPVLFRMTRRKEHVVSNTDKQYTMELSELFDINGGSNELRKKLIDGGAQSRKGKWHFTGAEQYAKTMQLLGRENELTSEQRAMIGVAQLETQPEPKPQTQEGNRFPSDKPNVANTPKSLPQAGQVVLPQTEPLPTTNGSLKAAVEAAQVEEVGDVTAGGLLERDEAGQVKPTNLMKLKPSRMVALETQVRGMRNRVTLGRSKEQVKGDRYKGMDAVQITTTSRQTIVLPEERDRAEQLRSRLRSYLEGVGTSLKGGWVAVPLDAERQFDERVKEVKQELREFNATSVVWNVFIYATKYQAMDDGETAARKLAYELKLLTDEVKEALDNCDAATIEKVTREMKAKSLALAPGQTKMAIENAITESRAMRSLINKLETKGSSISEIKQRMRTDIVESTRLMLDTFEVPEEVSGLDMGVDTSRLAGIVGSNDEGSDDEDGGSEPGDGEGNGSGSGADDQMGMDLADRLRDISGSVVLPS
jgi:hypothetical protein